MRYILTKKSVNKKEEEKTGTNVSLQPKIEIGKQWIISHNLTQSLSHTNKYMGEFEYQALHRRDLDAYNSNATIPMKPHKIQLI